jgi:hypothetical protein
MTSKNFGPETIVIGAEVERIFGLDGVRIKTSSILPINETGTIQRVFINRETQTVQIWANMDEGYARAFRPRQIETIEDLPVLVDFMYALARGDE